MPPHFKKVHVSTVRIAAIADLHVRSREDIARLDSAFTRLEEVADVLLLAGDLTELGLVAEMTVLAELLQTVRVPTFAVFGNHDRRSMRRRSLTRTLRDAGVRVLDGTGAMVSLPNGFQLGIAGVIGTGGGFRPGEQFGPGRRFTQAAMVKSRRESARLRRVMRELAEQEPTATLVMCHFSPTRSTLGTEPVLKYWMLGNALLGRTIDEFMPQLVIHGHAHLGNENGETEAGVTVRNVALPVTHGLSLYHLTANGEVMLAERRPITLDPGASSVRESDVR